MRRWRARRTGRFASCGFDAVWLADERFYREVYGALARIAVATSRVRLGPCVTDPFARHPALTAMAIATLDEIAEGRALLGLGAGVSGFAELGIQPKKPPRAIRESIALIQALLRGEHVDVQGEVISFRGNHLGFAAPGQHPGPRGQQRPRGTAGAADGAIMRPAVRWPRRGRSQPKCGVAKHRRGVIPAPSGSLPG
jgi:5,10-methylenetetrahydromethanopterin reductase